MVAPANSHRVWHSRGGVIDFNPRVRGEVEDVVVVAQGLVQQPALNKKIKAKVHNHEHKDGEEGAC